MLVLSRKINQSIMIGDGIEIRIVDIKGDQVKIGINAPKQVAVYRKEVYDEIIAQNIAASGTSIDISHFKGLGGKKTGLGLDDEHRDGQ